MNPKAFTKYYTPTPTEQLPVVPNARTFKVVCENIPSDTPFPLDKCIVIVSTDGSIYTRNRLSIDFYLLGTNISFQLKPDIVATDAKVYAFEYMADIAKTLRAGQCLDKYLWVPPVQPNSITVPKLIETIKSGVYVGASGPNGKRHITLAPQQDKIESLDRYGKMQCRGDVFHNYNNAVFLFYDKYLFFQWLNT